MDKLYEIMLNKNRESYKFFAMVYNALNKYSYDENEENVKELKALLNFINVVLPLPSGRYGNSLAVAFEMHLYKGALFIIRNAEELGIDLNNVSSEYGGNNLWNAKQTFEFSLNGFEMKKIEDNSVIYKDYPEMVKFNNSNIDAVLEISKILQVDYKKSR